MFVHELPEESLDPGGQQCVGGEQAQSTVLIAKLTLLQVLCLCVKTLMAKAMRKALIKNLHDIMHHMSSSDFFNRHRIFSWNSVS